MKIISPEVIEPRHVTKYEYSNGEKLDIPISWCGHEIQRHEWHFTDAQHVALAAGGSVQPCRLCVKAIIDALCVELN